MTRLTDQIDSSLARCKTAIGQTVTYARKAESVEVTTITTDQPEYESENEAGVVTRMEIRDFAILVADLILSGSGITPQRWDTITEGSDIFEVVDIPGIGIWDWIDPTRTMYRIHTKLKGSTGS